MSVQCWMKSDEAIAHKMVEKGSLDRLLCIRFPKLCPAGLGRLALLLRISETGEPLLERLCLLSLSVLLLPAHVLFLHVASEMRQTEKSGFRAKQQHTFFDAYLPFVRSVWAPKKGISLPCSQAVQEPGWKDDKGPSRWVFYFNELREFTGIFSGLLICLCRPLRISLHSFIAANHLCSVGP